MFFVLDLIFRFLDFNSVLFSPANFLNNFWSWGTGGGASESLEQRRRLQQVKTATEAVKDDAEYCETYTASVHKIAAITDQIQELQHPKARRRHWERIATSRVSNGTRQGNGSRMPRPPHPKRETR